ncbi:MAG: F0F1 ATP synthase subunit B [Elusimicrobia bacterium]|nr:F0F1 ATP synthase subunit B [Elusimicrobiota bacterium]
MIEINLGVLLVQVVTFLIGVGILWKIAWGPVTRLLRERREHIQRDLQTAERAKQDMERLKADYEQQLAQIEAKAKELFAQAQREGQQAREGLLRATQEEARRLTEKTRRQLEEEKSRLIKELRTEVANLSILATEKLVRQTIDQRVQTQFVEGLFRDLDKYSKEIH